MQVVPSWQDRDVTFPYTGHNVLQNEELSTELLYTRSFFREENNAETAFYLKNIKINVIFIVTTAQMILF